MEPLAYENLMSNLTSSGFIQPTTSQSSTSSDGPHPITSSVSDQETITLHYEGEATNPNHQAKMLDNAREHMADFP